MIAKDTSAIKFGSNTQYYEKEDDEEEEQEYIKIINYLLNDFFQGRMKKVTRSRLVF